MVGRGAGLGSAAGLGADEVINFEQEDSVAKVMELTKSAGVQEVFECSGAEGTFNQVARMVGKGGGVSLLKVPPDEVIEKIPFKYIVHNEIAIFGSRANPNVAWKIIESITSGQLKVKDLITHNFPLSEFAAAWNTFTTRKDDALKVVIESNGEEEKKAWKISGFSTDYSVQILWNV